MKKIFSSLYQGMPYIFLMALFALGLISYQRFSWPGFSVTSAVTIGYFLIINAVFSKPASTSKQEDLSNNPSGTVSLPDFQALAEQITGLKKYPSAFIFSTLIVILGCIILAFANKGPMPDEYSVSPLGIKKSKIEESRSKPESPTKKQDKKANQAEPSLVFEKKFLGKVSKDIVQYQVNYIDDYKYEIEPTEKYIQYNQQRSLLNNYSVGLPFFETSEPGFVVSIANSKTEDIKINSFYAVVKKIKLNKNPILIFGPTDQFYKIDQVLWQNVGYAKATDIVFNYAAFLTENDSKKDGSFNYKPVIGKSFRLHSIKKNFLLPNDEGTRLTFPNILNSIKKDYKNKKFKFCNLLPFDNLRTKNIPCQNVHVFGTFEYKDVNRKKHVHDFLFDINPPGQYGADGSVSYAMFLPANKLGISGIKELDEPIVIKPGEKKFFAIHIYSDKSAKFEYDIRFKTVSGDEIKSKEQFILDYFIPSFWGGDYDKAYSPKSLPYAVEIPIDLSKLAHIHDIKAIEFLAIKNDLSSISIYPSYLWNKLNKQKKTMLIREVMSGSIALIPKEKVAADTESQSFFYYVINRDNLKIEQGTLFYP